MSRLAAASTGFAFMLITMTGAAGAADQCPAELAQAKTALKSAQASLSKGSRTYAGAKGQDIQAPRQDVIQAPRQDVIQAPRVSQAATLVQESESACKSGDMATSTRKAKEALNLLKK